jgi:hypothetical protein
MLSMTKIFDLLSVLASLQIKKNTRINKKKVPVIVDQSNEVFIWRSWVWAPLGTAKALKVSSDCSFTRTLYLDAITDHSDIALRAEILYRIKSCKAMRLWYRFYSFDGAAILYMRSFKKHMHYTYNDILWIAERGNPATFYKYNLYFIKLFKCLLYHLWYLCLFVCLLLCLIVSLFVYLSWILITRCLLWVFFFW